MTIPEHTAPAEFDPFARQTWLNHPARGVGWDAFKAAMDERREPAQCYGAAYDALAPAVAALVAGREAALILGLNDRLLTERDMPHRRDREDPYERGWRMGVEDAARIVRGAS